MNMTPEEKISENLKRLFSFIDETTLQSFFTRLSDYINYLLETPTLKVIVEAEMKKRKAEYQREAELEQKAVQELRGAKSKLLKIIKDKKISPDALQGEWSSFPLEKGTILDELESFEQGKIHTSIPHSNQLARYLFEIAVGISRQGYKHLLQEFDEHQPYQQNTYGNFIFSKTLKGREEQTKRIEMAKGFELWGYFVPLLNFQKAFLEVPKNSHYLDVFQRYSRDGKNRLDNLDAGDITHMSEELKQVMRSEYRGQKLPFYLLEIEKYKSFATRVHHYLLTELSKRASLVKDKQTVGKTIVIDFQKGIYDPMKKKSIYEIRGKRRKIVEYLTKNSIASLSDLVATTGQTNALIVKEIKEINKNFRNILQVKDDLIVHSKTGGGYRLNRDSFSIKTST